MTAITLLELVRGDLGVPARVKGNNHWWKCPFHQEDTASLQVDFYDKRQKWRWKCWGCNKEGDAQDWLVAYRHMSTGDAWRLLNGDSSPPPRIEQRAPTVDYAQPPAQEWQDAALDMVLDCAANLASKDKQATAAREWLGARGLRPLTIERALLGWNPQWREVLPGQWLGPGITIPCWTANDLWYVKVRLTRKEAQKRGDKYLALTGSRTASLYNAESLKDVRVAVATEGEFDALLLSQFFGTTELAVVTMGSASSLPSPRWKAYLAWLDKLLVVMDADTAGERAADKWRDVVQWVQAVEPPSAEGKDITDWWRAGVNLRSWLEPYLAGPSPEEARVREILASVKRVDMSDARQDALLELPMAVFD